MIMVAMGKCFRKFFWRIRESHIMALNSSDNPEQNVPSVAKI
jgi:hypothetical protein